MPALYGMPASARRTSSHSRGSKPALHGGLVVVSLLCVVNKVVPRAGFFGATAGRGGGGGGAQSAPSKNPVPLLRIYSSDIFLKACPKLSLVKQTWFPWQP